ncbi:MAG: response regulator [Anaerolineae bacterium]|nr:response regulator [Anaerolineae bacterium]
MTGKARCAGEVGQVSSPVRHAFALGWPQTAIALVAVLYLTHYVTPYLPRAELSTYLVQPLLWVALAGVALASGPHDLPRPDRWMVSVAALLGLFQVALFLVAGMLSGFGISPYSRGLLPVVLNLVYVFSRLLGLEMTRWRLLRPLMRSAGAGGMVLVWLGLALASLPLSGLNQLPGPASAFRLTGRLLLPAASESLLATYLAMVSGPTGALAYRGALAAFEWLFPLLPNPIWPITAFLGTVSPLLGLLVVRDLAEFRRAKDLSDALNRINAIINSSLDIDRIMQRVVTESGRVLEADFTCVVARRRGSWRVRYAHGVAPTVSWADADEAGLSLPGRLRSHGDILAVEDVRRSEWRGHRALQRSGVRAFLAVPLAMRRDVIGVLAFSSYSGPASFSAAQLDFARKLSASISLALANARLYQNERRQHLLLDAVVRNAPAAIAVLDGRSLKVRWANPAAVKALDRPLPQGDIAGVRLEELLPGAAEAGIVQAAREVLRRRTPLSAAEGRYAGFARGQTYWRFTLLPLNVPGKELPDLLVVALEVTEQVRARQRIEDMAAEAERKLQESLRELERTQQQLFRAQKLESIGRLAGGIAHDFNNVLTAIIGYAQIVLASLPEGPAQQDVEEILRAAKRATELTNRLLAFSRRQVIRLRPVAPDRLIQDMGELLRGLTGEDIHIVARLGAEGAAIEADPDLLEQAVVNLVTNARDAMPEGGVITIETREVFLNSPPPGAHLVPSPGHYVELAISDNGTGMSDEVKEHLFEPFFTTKGTGGGGLGLATVYGIVRQHGGGIAVSSELAKGSTFSIYLPCAQTKATLPATEGQPQPDHLPRGQEVVLVAEDEEAVRSIVVRMLHRQGYRVLEAEDGRTGLELSRRHQGPIHLLLTDVVMPGMGGRELAEHVRRERPETRVLFMSGYNTEENLLRLPGSSDPVELLPKPFNHHDLALKVRETLDAQ